jgi:hypothetical protein
MSRTDHTTDDLRTLLVERSTTVLPPRPGRADEVSGRVRGIRRRRVAATGLSVVLAVIAVIAGAGLLSSGHRQRAVPAYQRKVDGLPVYQAGYRLVGHVAFHSDDKRSASFDFMPSTYGMALASVCSADSKRPVSVQVNGHLVMAGTCGGQNLSAPTFRDDAGFWRDEQVRLGQPMTVEGQVVERLDSRNPQLQTPTVYRGPMRDVRVSVGLYQRVPVSAYPFPPRPRRLQPLDDHARFDGGRVLHVFDSRTIGATGSAQWTTRIPTSGLSYAGFYVAPGALTISVDGTVVDRQTSWNYAGSGSGGPSLDPGFLQQHGVNVAVGDRVTIAVRATRFQDPAWELVVRAGR